jgi:hypothetical protein
VLLASVGLKAGISIGFLVLAGVVIVFLFALLLYGRRRDYARASGRRERDQVWLIMLWPNASSGYSLARVNPAAW